MDVAAMSEIIHRARPASPRALLNGLSPKERAQEKRELALSWLAIFHYSTEQILKQLLGIKGNGITKWLHAKKLIQPIPVFAISSRHVWILTPAGLEEAGMYINRPLHYPHNPERISEQFLRHQLLTQMMVAKNFCQITAGTRNIQSARMLSTSALWDGAIPDAVWWHPSVENIKRTALEIELTYKKPHEIEEKLNHHLNILLNTSDVKILWAFPSAAMRERYEKIWKKVTSEVLDADNLLRIQFEAHKWLGTAIR